MKLGVGNLVWVRGHQDINQGGQSKVQPDSFATRQQRSLILEARPPLFTYPALIPCRAEPSPFTLHLSPLPYVRLFHGGNGNALTSDNDRHVKRIMVIMV